MEDGRGKLAPRGRQELIRLIAIDALDHAELVGRVEQTGQLAALGRRLRGGAPEALAGKVGLHAGPVGREAEGPWRRGHGLGGRLCDEGRFLDRPDGLLTRLRLRQPALDEPPERWVLRRGRLRRPIHRPTGVTTG
jgi:hypothetical protein